MNYDDEQNQEPERLTMDCGYPGCCMPGLHFPSECHNAEDIEELMRCERVDSANTTVSHAGEAITRITNTARAHLGCSELLGALDPRNQTQRMKNMIRKWLGVDKLEAPKPLDKTELRRMVGQAVADALEGKSDYESLWFFPCERMKNIVERCVEKAATEPARITAEKAIEARISGEKFVDEVVERIKRKQLSA
jgi:hypothetical protein